MKNTLKKFTALGLVVVALGGNSVIAAPLTATSSASEQNVGMQGITGDRSYLRYSDMVQGDGAADIFFTLNGVTLTTDDPYAFDDAMTHNYDVDASTGVSYKGDMFFLNVNWSNPGIKFVGDWIININGSMFSDGKARTITVPIINDLGDKGQPTVTTNVDKGVTVQQLLNGFDLEMNISNATFNTACFGNYIRMSMMDTSGLRLYPVAYCDSLKANQVKMRVQVLNYVESWRTHLEFKLQGDAIKSSMPITVRIPIIR